ncbi:hypothetical protein D9M68_875400 [compost metagenome]
MLAYYVVSDTVLFLEQCKELIHVRILPFQYDNHISIQCFCIVRKGKLFLVPDLLHQSIKCVPAFRQIDHFIGQVYLRMHAQCKQTAKNEANDITHKISTGNKQCRFLF